MVLPSSPSQMEMMLCPTRARRSAMPRREHAWVVARQNTAQMMTMKKQLKMTKASLITMVWTFHKNPKERHTALNRPTWTIPSMQAHTCRDRRLTPNPNQQQRHPTDSVFPELPCYHSQHRKHRETLHRRRQNLLSPSCSIPKRTFSQTLTFPIHSSTTRRLQLRPIVRTGPIFFCKSVSSQWQMCRLPLPP